MRCTKHAVDMYPGRPRTVLSGTREKAGEVAESPWKKKAREDVSRLGRYTSVSRAVRAKEEQTLGAAGLSPIPESRVSIGGGVGDAVLRLGSWIFHLAARSLSHSSVLCPARTVLQPPTHVSPPFPCIKVICFAQQIPR